MFVRQKRRRAPARKKKPSGRGRQVPVRNRLMPETVEQRHLDILGLCLVATGLYLCFVLYFGWDGGKVGSGGRTALTFMLGKVAYMTPIALFISGGALIMKPLIPAMRPLRTGGICVAVGLLLAFAAETAGLGAVTVPRGQVFDTSWFPEHGGLVGESLYWLTSNLFQRVGSHIIAVVTIAAGVLLLTGTSIATFLAASGHAVRKAGAGSGDMARTVVNLRRGSETGADPTRHLVEDEEVTDVMSAYPEGDEFEPTVSVLDDEDANAETVVINSDDVLASDQSRVGADSDHVDGFDAEPHDLEAEVNETEIAPLGKPEQLELTPMGKKRGVTTAEQISYRLPPRNSLEKGRKDSGPDPKDQAAVGQKLVEALGHFGVEAKIIGIVSGPHVSRYELKLAPGIKVKKVTELSNDLAYALASTDIRILAPIPGKQAVGVEVPNLRRRIVRLGDIYEPRPDKGSPLVAWLGKGIDGKPVWTDLTKMPHVLVAGTTGSGKSACVNTILTSILMHSSPNEVRLVLVDPKQVELNHYENVPHLLTPVVTSPRLAANVLQNLIAEMESRYGIMGQARARNLAELNRARMKAGEEPLPHILCVIDELADLMMVAPADVEDSIIRLAQKSRATGIHLVLATQRPSTDIITGTIKVNIPARIAFAVSSQTDSRVILDQGGAESLLGQGDMLFRGAGSSKLQRVQGAFVSEEEIAKVTEFWSRQGEPEFEAELLEAKELEPEEAREGDFDPDQDDLLDDAIRLVIETETASVSMIQRRLRVGYTRAGRLVDMLERRGVISGYEGSKPRQVLITRADMARVLGPSPGGTVAPPDDETGAEVPEVQGQAVPAGRDA